MKKIDVLILLLFCLLLATLGLATHKAIRASIVTENVLLKQQLEQAHSLAGRPINIAALPDGSYARADDDKHFAFVQSVADFPVGPVGVPYAVYCEKGEIPYHFATKDIRKEVEEFVRKNPPSPK